MPRGRPSGAKEVLNLVPVDEAERMMSLQVGWAGVHACLHESVRGWTACLACLVGAHLVFGRDLSCNDVLRSKMDISEGLVVLAKCSS